MIGNTKKHQDSSFLIQANAVRCLSAGAALVMLLIQPCKAQKYTTPNWWFGGAAAANFNYYTGSTQRANEVTYFPSAFGNGSGVGIFAAASIEYRIPHSMFGLMLLEGFDNRRGHFNLPDQKFSAHLTYFSIEPAIRLAPFKFPLYFYGGPRFGFLITSDFSYQRKGFPDYPDRTINPDNKFYISSLRKNPVSTQLGAGYDFRFFTDRKDQMIISPFVTYFPTMWRKNIRSIDRLYLNTIRAGIAIKFGRAHMQQQAPMPAPPVVISDRDGDGVPDFQDECPDLAGLTSLRGCPDRDGDGIYDMDDKCPDVAGVARYQGCPIPDADKDGINDEVDKCPDAAGLARYQGCPIPDTDGDAVNDEEDKCINEKGPVSNFGCPVINEEIIKRVNLAAKNVFFATASDKLLAQSNKRLSDVVTILNENPSFKIQIDGHTDDQGKDEYNLDLSDRRAASVKAYLVSKGIADNRLSSTGYGETKPVDVNTTAAGRAKNRRVEMTLSNY